MSLKQLGWRALVAALAFVIGVAVSLPWRMSDASRAQFSIIHAESRAISACDALRSPALHARGNVRLRGALYGNADGTLVLNELECSGDGAWLTVRLEDSLAEKAEVRRFIDLMRKQSRNETMARAEVLVVGKLMTQGFPSDSKSRVAISLVELEQVTPISIVSFVSN